MTKQGTSIIIFPYLFSQSPLIIGDGMEFKPSTSFNIENEPKTIQKHLKSISTLFSTGNSDATIENFMYWYGTGLDKDKGKQAVDDLRKYLTVARFHGLTKGGAQFEHFTFALFWFLDDEDYEYYNCLINGHLPLDFYIGEGVFKPEIFNETHVLFDDDENKISEHVYLFNKHYYSDGEIQALIRSLEWFNKSYRESSNIEDYEKLVNIATAFETLFGAPETDIATTVRQCILMLLGETAELSKWIRDFYNKRSTIVHGRGMPEVLYKDKGATKPHIHDILFAQRVYIVCISTILKLREGGMHTRALKEDLISNERRLKKLRENLKKVRSKTAEELHQIGVFNLISDLNRRDPTGKQTMAIEVGKIFLSLIKDILPEDKYELLQPEIDSILNFNAKEVKKLAFLYSGLHKKARTIYLDETVSTTDRLSILSTKSALYNFTSYVAWKLKLRGD